MVKSFIEKPQVQKGWINGGFFILNKKIFNYIKNSSTVFESEPLSKLSKKKVLLDQKYSYSDLYLLTNEYYSFFKSKLTQGQIISLILPYSIDFIAVILAARLNKNILCVLN